MPNTVHEGQINGLECAKRFERMTDLWTLRIGLYDNKFIQVSGTVTVKLSKRVQNLSETFVQCCYVHE